MKTKDRVAYPLRVEGGTFSELTQISLLIGGLMLILLEEILPNLVLRTEVGLIENADVGAASGHDLNRAAQTARSLFSP